MLSILIPTYNFDCLNLISTLVKQCEKLLEEEKGFAYEVVVLDDGSSDTGLVEHVKKGCCKLRGVRWISGGVNSGRATVRNRLLNEACGEWVVMIDDDAQVVSDEYVSNYWKHRFTADVLCGDLLNYDECPTGCELRFYYEKAAEPMRSVVLRNQAPYDRFSTFNFMARRDVMLSIGFRNSLKEYGYEDVLLGFELEARGHSVLHIDNPLLHTGIDRNEDFLRKTRAAMRSLADLPISVRRRIGVSCVALRLEQLRLSKCVGWCLGKTLSLLERNLLGRHPKILFLQLYKLGYFLQISAKS